jgi:hypothetical protein
VSQALYEIYRRKNYDLASTLVVKFQAAAQAINDNLSLRGYVVNAADPTTWKYYLNLAGEYHPSDVVMTVKSLDTLQNIEFTRINLQQHLATAREYQYGGEYYNDLVARYPDQEMLILGILHPVPIAKALAAPDGQILYYNPALVEENETNVIPRLQQWIQNFLLRWNIGAYAAVDELYLSAVWWVLFTNIPNKLENIRFSNTHTIYAHSFHIRQFLASQGKLDQYVDALTTKQLLFLYRNIRYLHRNVGKTETFELLIKRLLTERGFPLAEWRMEHNTADMLDEIYPDIEFSRHTLNAGTTAAGVDTISVAQILDKEIPAAKGNGDNLGDVEATVTELMENSRFNQLTTKVLESSILDLTDAFPYTQSDLLLYHWIYMANTGRYNAFVTVDDPKSGGRLTLSVKDAFIAYMYLFNQARGLVLEQLPALGVRMIRRPVTPTFAQLRQLAEPKVVPDALLQRVFTNLHVLPNQYISTESFYRSVVAIYTNLMDQRFLWASQHDYKTRGQLKTAALNLYGNYLMDLGSDRTYAQWFAELGMDFSTYNSVDSEALGIELLSAATGTDLRIGLTLKEIQASMLKLMGQLSSYSVQYLQSINSDPIKVVDWTTTAPTVPNIRGAEHSQANVVVVRGLELRGRGRERMFIDIADLSAQVRFNSRVRQYDWVDMQLWFTQSAIPKLRQSMLLPRFDILSSTTLRSQITDVTKTSADYYRPIDRAPLVDAFVGLVADHYVLTEEDRENLVNRWADWEQTHPIVVEDPRYTITEPHLEGYVAPPWHLSVTTLTDLQYPDPVDLGTLVLTDPLAPQYPIDELLDLTLTELPAFDGLSTAVGAFTPHALLAFIDLPNLRAPVVALQQRLNGYSPRSVTLDPLMYGLLVLGDMNATLNGHQYTPPTP